MALEVGTHGVLGGQAVVEGVEGVWEDLTDNVNVGLYPNLLPFEPCADISNRRWLEISPNKCERSPLWYVSLTPPSRACQLTDQTKSVARGDLTKTIEADVQGEILELKIIVNDMVSLPQSPLICRKVADGRQVSQLTVFAAEVTRVSLEVGTEGQLGGQALVPNVEGTWKVLTDNVNLMVSRSLDMIKATLIQQALNLTTQVRSVAEVTTAVAEGDLSKKIIVEAFGEILELKVCLLSSRSMQG